MCHDANEDIISQAVSLQHHRLPELLRLAPHFRLQLPPLGTGHERGALAFLAAADERSGCRIAQDRIQVISRALLARPREEIYQAEMS